jgi:hypothetical protein
MSDFLKTVRITGASGRINLWTVALILVAAQPSWAGLSLLVLMLVRTFGLQILRQKNSSKLLTDTARLSQIENDVRALTNIKNLGR